MKGGFLMVYSSRHRLMARANAGASISLSLKHATMRRVSLSTTAMAEEGFTGISPNYS